MSYAQTEAVPLKTKLTDWKNALTKFTFYFLKVRSNLAVAIIVFGALFIYSPQVLANNSCENSGGNSSKCDVVDPTPEPEPEPTLEPTPVFNETETVVSIPDTSTVVVVVDPIPTPLPVEPVPAPAPAPVPAPVEPEIIPSPAPEPIPVDEPVQENNPEPTPEPVPVEPLPEPSPEPPPIPEPEPEPELKPEPPVVEPSPEVIQPKPPIKEEMVTLNNGVVLTQTQAIAVALLQDPSALFQELFSNPGAVFSALSHVGADMSPEVRKESEQVVLSAIIAGGIATQAAASTGAVTYRRKP